MIKAEELMIGDWVMSIHPAVPRPIKVTEVGEDDIGYKNGILHISFIEPIPITPEILEKNGFGHETNVGYVFEDYEYEIIYDSWEHKLRILKNREQILKIDFFNEMCVHELQHALKLCGISKTLNYDKRRY